MAVKKYLPIAEAAAELGVSTKHIYTLLQVGGLKAIDISASGRGGPQSLRISSASLEDFKVQRKFDPGRDFT